MRRPISGKALVCFSLVAVAAVSARENPSVAEREVSREFLLDGRYLAWPVERDLGQPKQRFFITLDGEEKPLLFADILLSRNPDFWVFTDLADHQGRTVTVSGEVPAELLPAWEKLSVGETFPGEPEVYAEPLRPQYHFSSRRGWLNDPNGLVWHDGAWHLFYQHNPYNHNWNNMTWGHATSPDLFHWTELPPALLPDEEGVMFSGSGFVVPEGSAGFPVEGGGAVALAYTAWGQLSPEPGRRAEQGIAISGDGGRTFRKFGNNPVLPFLVEGNRDPKVFRHEPTDTWVMALYLEGDRYSIHTSPDLVAWTETDTYRIPGDSECPDLFELPVDGDPENTRWVAWGALGKYVLGSFDGRDFQPAGEPRQHYFGAAYAGQTFDNAPDGRRVHIGWMRDTGAGFQGSAFNQQMTLPMDFSLRDTGHGARLWIEPSAEVEALRGTTHEWSGLVLGPHSADPLADFDGGPFEIEAVIDAAATTGEAGFRIFDDYPAVWNAAEQTFTGAEGPQPAVDGKVGIRVFVDTVSMEVFVNGTYVSRYIRQMPGAKPIRIVAQGGEVKFDSLKVHALKSVWK